MTVTASDSSRRGEKQVTHFSEAAGLMSPSHPRTWSRGGRGSITRDAISACRRVDLYHLYSFHDLDNRIKAPARRVRAGCPNGAIARATQDGNTGVGACAWNPQRVRVGRRRKEDEHALPARRRAAAQERNFSDLKSAPQSSHSRDSQESRPPDSKALARHSSTCAAPGHRRSRFVDAGV